MTKKIELTNHNVEVKTELSWYETEQLQALLLGDLDVDVESIQALSGIKISGKALLEVKEQTIEYSIVKITDKDGKEIKYTNEWLRGLSQKDGQKLYEAVDTLGISGKKK